LSDGNIGHPPAPGTGVPARAGPAPTPTVADRTVTEVRRRAPHEALRGPGTTWRHDIPRMVGSSAPGLPAVTPAPNLGQMLVVIAPV
jgi:hypothetical protein